jgi:formylglycine-generating enzyme required for sulfatase activity
MRASTGMWVLGVSLAASCLAVGGCKKDECLGADAQAQIDVQLSSLTSLGVANVDVMLIVNGGQPTTRRFDATRAMTSAVPTLSFVYAFGALNVAPRALVIKALAYDNAGKVVGSGQTSVTFTSDACNFFTVTLQPGKAPDAGLDGPRPEGPRIDGPKPDTFYITTGFAQIPKGTFTMGSLTTEPCRSVHDDEDRHEVKLTRDFEIKKTEVTQAEFLAAMGYNNSSFKSCGTDCPVELVTWHEATAYCNKLSTTKGLAPCYTCNGTEGATTCEETASYSGAKFYDCPGYRLPTEAEWEYAYRAGTTTAFYNGANDPSKCTECDDAKAILIAWHKCNGSGTTHAVAKLAPNAWGIYDMAGNVLEWCEDWYGKSFGLGAAVDPWGPATGAAPEPRRVARGGYWNYDPANLRAASREDIKPDRRLSEVGFRCVRTLP